MDKVKQKNKIITNFSAVAVFVVSYVLCAVFGWIDVVKTLFDPSGDNVGEVFKMPPTYTIVCFLFVAVLCAFVIFGIKLKSRLMVLFAATYELLFVISFILLVAFVSGNITNETLFNVIMYFLTAVLLPVYGVIWNINRLFFLIFIPLVILTIVALVKVFKKNK